MNSTGLEGGAYAGDGDAGVVDLCRGGDRLAFDRLVLKYRDRILTLCTWFLGDRDEGEDAAQDTFVRVYRAIGSFKGDCLFSTWLSRIAVNVCRNRRGAWWSRISRRAIRLDAAKDGDDGPVREIADSSMSPDGEFERRRKAAAVAEALRKVPAKFRELIILRDIQEMSYEEIRTITGLELGTVKSRLARARDAVREKLEGKIDVH